MKVHIIVPVYREADNIAALLSEIDAVVKSDKEVLLIFDDEDDPTVPATKGLLSQGVIRSPVTLVRNAYGRGVLGAIKTGFLRFKDGVAVVVMADLSDQIDLIDRMREMIEEGLDLVCASRFMKGGRMRGGAPLKGFFSRFIGTSLHVLTGIPVHDLTNSFKMYSRKVIDEISTEADGGFEIGMEIALKAHFAGFKIGEIPCTWKDRTAGKSKFKMWKWAPKYARWYFYALFQHFCRRKAPG